MTKSRGVSLWIAAASIAAGCADGVETSSGVREVGNSAVIAEGMHNAVGKVLMSPGPCSGTLIADGFVLTAAHCICGDEPRCDAPDVTGSFRFVHVSVLNGFTPGDVEYLVSDAYVHPDYEVGVWAQNDIAVLELVPRKPGEPTADVLPLPLATAVPDIDDLVTLVGYGESGLDCSADADYKRAGETTVEEVIDGGAGDITLRYDEKVLLCHGDSGGPALVGDRSQVAAVHSTTGNHGKAVAAYLPWIQMQLVSPGNHVAAFDLSGGGPAGESLYRDQLPDSQLGWLDPGDVQLTGDFMNLGTDQILYLNRGGSLGQIRIASYADHVAPAENLYWRSWSTQPSAFDDFVQPNDRLYVGDFRGVGHDQLLMLNQSGGSGSDQLRVIDFSAGYAQTWYASTYVDEPLVGWHDVDDSIVIGDFRDLGYDQVMFINRAGTDGRIAIVDLQDGSAPGEWVYFEHHADGVQLNGWTDPGDLAVAGDFRGLGHDQVMFVNRGAGTGRFLVADFSDGVFPAEWQYYEPYGASTFLDGFHDTTVDVAIAGDFRGLGYDQMVFVNRDVPSFARVMVVDFYDGVAPSNPGFVQTSALASPLLSRIGATDIVLAGTLTSIDRVDLVTIEP